MDHLYCDIPISSPRPFSWERCRSIPVEECGEELVPTSLVPEKILLWPQYYIHGVGGAIPECYVRRSVLPRLLSAAALLPAGCRLAVVDAWRSRTVQITLFQSFRSELRERMPLLDDKEISSLAAQFVAPPSAMEDNPFPHITGGAVDLSIVNESGMFLPMGAAFDETSKRSATAYYEEKLASRDKMSREDTEALTNRRLLYGVMTAAGFTNYPEQWWHYDYGNQSWAYLKQEGAALYGPCRPAFRWATS